MPGLDPETLRHALNLAQRHGYRKVRLREGDMRFEAVLSAQDGPWDEDPEVRELETFEESAVNDEGFVLTAPVVGYLREVATPLAVGRKVDAGETVAEIVALGLANDVVSPASGEVVELLVEPGSPVEYGQVLAKVKPL